MAIEYGTAEYLRYRTSFLRGLARSKDCVLVTWPSGFSHSVTAETWDARAFLREPEKAHLLEGHEEGLAKALFARSA